MQPDREWLDQRALARGNIVRQLVQAALAAHYEFRVAARQLTESEHPIAPAMVALAARARLAFAAVIHGSEATRSPISNPANAVTYFIYLAAKFVAHDGSGRSVPNCTA